MGEFAAWAAILGDIGDFIGSIAVLITLIYLALQVKHGQAMLALDNGFYQSRLGLIQGQMAETAKVTLVKLLPVFKALGVGLLPEAQKIMDDASPVHTT